MREAQDRVEGPKLPRENAYRCRACGWLTVTVDVDHGVTPMFLDCRAKPGCKGLAESLMYPKERRPTDIPAPAWEWYKPDARELRSMRQLKDPSLDHVERGGLLIRSRTNREPIYHGQGSGA